MTPGYCTMFLFASVNVKPFYSTLFYIEPFTFTCIGEFVPYLNIITESHSCWCAFGDLLTETMLRYLCCLASVWQPQDVRLLSWETDRLSRNN